MAARRRTPPETPAAGWFACHLHYHEDLDRVLLELVVPQVRRGLAEGEVDRFFFVRYALGGPHVRLRMRAAAASSPGAAARRLVAAAEAFVARRPSREAWPEEVTRRRNRAILAHDPAEGEDLAYPDNSARIAPYLPETSRYGGVALMAASQEVFTLSSLAALAVLIELAARGAPGGVRLNACFRQLARQAMGAAAALGGTAGTLLADLAGRAGATFPAVVAKADRAFEEGRELYLRLWAGALDEAAEDPLALGTAWLGHRLTSAPIALRGEILGSHLHMSANRLGLSNREEAYLYGLLHRAAATRPADSGAGGELGVLEGLAGPVDAAEAELRLSHLAETTLERFARGGAGESMSGRYTSEARK